jgi:hypothetical protein
MEGVKETIKHISQGSGPSWDLNLASPEYETGMVTTMFNYSSNLGM